MDRRLELQALLEEVLGSDQVFFQRPPLMQMRYPAIVYSRSGIDNLFADNLVYRQVCSYEVIVMDEDPDSEIVFKVSQLRNCRHSRRYVSDNLNHDAFTIYF